LVLPAALREGYALIADRFDLTQGYTCLLKLYQLHVDDSGQALVFRREAEGVAEWGVPMSVLFDADPPVVTGGDGQWEPFLDRFSLAFVDMVLSEAVFAVEFSGNLELDDEDVVSPKRHYRQLSIPEHPLWAGSGPVRWFEGYGAFMVEHAGTWLWVGAASAAALATVRQVLPGDWAYEEA
jgi:hypothetical protein